MELHIATRTVTDEQGKLRRFHYILLVHLIESNSFVCEDYGVCIREEHGSSSAIAGITTSAMRIDELMTLLTEQTVSPTALADVVADWL